MLNSRSLYNKAVNFRTLLHEIGPDLTIVSETWERQRQSLDDLISSSQFETISYRRRKVTNRQPGGGCAIIYNSTRFKVEKMDVQPPEKVEVCWAFFTPKASTQNSRVKKIAVGAVYVAPNSKFKRETIDHIIETIHYVRSTQDNVNFLIGGDLNRLKIDEILECHGALKQIVSVPTRINSTLEKILTDLHPFYHPPTTLPPLQVDAGKTGSDSDHNIILMAPLANNQYKINRVKKTIKTRPLPASKIEDFGRDITSHNWDEVKSVNNIDEKTMNFHQYLVCLLNKHFPEKYVKISSLDKKWFNPKLKLLHRKVQREFVKHRKSSKWKKLKKKFKQLKRKAIKTFYSKFVNDLKVTNPGKWYQMAKQIGAVDQMNEGDIQVEILEGLSNKESAIRISENFSSISNEYSPLDICQLPSYLPAQAPPQLEEYEVYLRLQKQKKTKSTLPLDIPHSLKKEFAAEISTPLTEIINECLKQNYYPKLWKLEWVTPVPKITNPKILKDLRKISCTSSFSKIFEGFLKDWILEDISAKIDIGQFGGQEGTGTEHLIVCLLDRVLSLLDKNTDLSAVIAASVDWAAAFDRQDPTKAIQKFIEIGVRPSLIPVLIIGV